ncbi:MAG: TIGR03663 family protein [Nanoarchaeota archaeon]|nr:TIGR03663 family protein [Nanoarchaeota archaeon]
MRKLNRNHIIIGIIILAIISRLIFLDIRPLHHDEGVNYFFADNILEGRGFAYDPLNYHGPSYFFILFLSFFLLGVNEFALRFPSAIFGIALVIIPLFLKNRRSYNKYLFSSLLLISPSLLYYSRYSIHESLFILAGFLGVYSLTTIIESKNLEQLPLFALSLALLLVTKETTIIMGFIMAVIVAVNYKEISDIDFNDRKKIWASIVLFLLIYIVLFTSFFSNFSGLKNSFNGYLSWTERGLNEPGHQKPFYYYIELIAQYEFPLLLLSLVGLWACIKDRRNIFMRNMAIWFVFIFLIYSFIGYKTPWLVVNITLPMIMMAVIGIRHIPNRKISIAITGVAVIYLVFFSIYVNYVHTWQSDNYFAYVHTDGDILNLIKDLEGQYKSGERILIVSDSYWPLPFYLDNKNVEYLDKVERAEFGNEYDYYIVKGDIFSNSILPDGYRYREYKLRDDVKLDLVYKIK